MTREELLEKVKRISESDIRVQISNMLKLILENINSLFEPNELAYLSLQGKNELQIRDRIAFILQQAIDPSPSPKYLVKKELSISGRDSIDLAVLEMDNQMDNQGKIGKILTLIEFKANAAQTFEKSYHSEFVHDVAKCASCNAEYDTDVYFIMFQVWHNAAIDNYTEIVKYSNSINTSVKASRKEKDLGKWWNDVITTTPDRINNCFVPEITDSEINIFKIKDIGSYLNYNPSLYVCLWKTEKKKLKDSIYKGKQLQP